jgi:AIPR protein
MNLNYPAILSEITPFLASGRSESASFLAWYFYNFLRLDEIESVDCVCDQRGDKGIDGIYLNKDAEQIEVYQSKISQRLGSTIGDSSLREFQGTLSQLATAESLQNLIDTASNTAVSQLAKRLELIKYIGDFRVVGFFVANSEIDANGSAFLSHAQNITFIGKSQLESTFISTARDVPSTDKVEFDIAGLEAASYTVDQTHHAVIAPIKASQLISLDGISNQRIFAYNVRGPLGRTQVNKDIVKSINDPSLHRIFPLFHNGITVIAEEVGRNDDAISIRNYFVVNGCQSLSALHNHRAQVSDDLRLLVKFIQAPPDSELSRQITRYSNNQNGVRPRDFKSNHEIQIRLQNEVRSHYGSEYFYEIKRGEGAGGLIAIGNETAGQYLMAYDLKEPWATHRKYQIFEDKYNELFARPAVSADRIIFLQAIASVIEAKKSEITNQLFARYALSTFFLMYALRLAFETDDSAITILEQPERYVREPAPRHLLQRAVGEILSELITDLNAELSNLGADFDYRGKLRDSDWTKKMASELVTTRKKLVDRGRLPKIAEILASYT